MLATFISKSLPNLKKIVKASICSHEIHRAQNYQSLRVSRCISSIPVQNDAFAVSYLINSLEFSRETALKLASSGKLHFQDPGKPDLILKFFQNHGFLKTQVSNIIRKCPLMLLSNPETSILPKFEYLTSKGLCNDGLVKLISLKPEILRCSLEKYLVPNYNFFKTVLGSDEKVFLALRYSHWIWGTKYRSYAMENIAILREYGVPESNIMKLVIWHSKTLMIDDNQFTETIEEVKELGISPLHMLFVMAVRVKRAMHKTTWEKKLNVYRKWGLSDKEILLAFCKQPHCMMYSEGKIMATMDFFINKMGWESSLIARHPSILSSSLERRIIPRCSVLKALLSKGLSKKKISLTSLLMGTEEVFLQKYVTRYENEAPNLLKLYRERLNHAMHKPE